MSRYSKLVPSFYSLGKLRADFEQLMVGPMENAEAETILSFDTSQRGLVCEKSSLIVDTLVIAGVYLAIEAHQMSTFHSVSPRTSG